MPYKDECGLCGRVFSVRYLKRCERCGRLFCQDCMVADVSTGDPMRLLCLNCARRTVARRKVNRFEGLGGYLRFRGAFTKVVKLSFVRVDGIIGDNLPMEAYKSEAWWSNDSNSVHARGWLDAGWRVREMNLKEGYVVFEKFKDVPLKRRDRRVKKPFVPARVRFPRRKQPSNTKVSKLYARIKNVERRKSALPRYRGSFKPKSGFEKRLFKEKDKL
ncbi:MAG TPA: hypothetical protein VMT26_02645 [Candidatus Bathyarchaeia archaeon]|nr:hypothetical protein [Candidatus Bathyarchaeia archaeon]